MSEGAIIVVTLPVYQIQVGQYLASGGKRKIRHTGSKFPVKKVILVCK